jgi:O-antigen ligase
MRLARTLSEAEAKKVQTFVLLGGVFTTLTIWTKLEDPINLPKMFVLALFAAIILGLSLPAMLSVRKIPSKSQIIGLVLVCVFLIGLLISTIATDVKYTAIFGEFHRNNGFISYFAMIAILVASALVFNFGTAIRYFHFFAATGVILTFYGLLQGANLDPVGWVIDYNPYITTLGNPNFTSALLGLSGIAILYLLLETKNRKPQVLFAVSLFADLYILFKSGSIQGLFGFAIGATVLLLTKAWIFNKRFGQIGLIAAGLASTPIALALVNLGPLASKLYQGTLRNRLDYWYAAVEMFRDHPIFGVGIDRFGEYYRQYASQNQVVQGQVTDNAHSVYLQILATGGLVSFLPYAIFVFFITVIGLRALLCSVNSQKLKIAGLFGIWLGTVAINIVTVDNLGVGVWFWITGGVLLSLSLDRQNYSESVLSMKPDLITKRKQNSRKTAGPSSHFPLNYLISGALAFGVILALVPQLNSSSNLKAMMANQFGLTGQAYNDQVTKLAKENWSSPQILIQLSALSFKNSDLVTGDSILDRVFILDDRSYYANYFRAFTLEAVGKKSDAIAFRERLKILDPWNNASLIELAKDYLAVGDKDSAASIVALIRKNYPGSQADIDASALLVG